MPVVQLLSCKMMKWVVARQKGGSMYAGHKGVVSIYMLYAGGAGGRQLIKQIGARLGREAKHRAVYPEHCLCACNICKRLIVWCINLKKKKVISKSRRSVVISCLSINKKSFPIMVCIV